MYLSTYRSKVLDLQNDWGTPPRRAAESPDLEAVSLYLSRLAGAGHTFAAGRNRIRPLGGGFNNSIYEVDTATGIYIIKVYPADRAQRLERESAAMERLSFLDAVPRPLSADPWTAEMKAPVLIYEKLPGSPVESARMTREDLNLLMETLVEVHDLKVPPDSPLARPSGPARPMDCLGYIDKTMRDMAKSAALNDPPFRQTLDRLHDLRRCLSMMDLKPALWAESHPCLCHGDFQAGERAQDGSGPYRPGRLGARGCHGPALRDCRVFLASGERSSGDGHPRCSADRIL